MSYFVQLKYDLRKDVKELGELKKSMEELTKASGNIERSLKVMEFKLYHNEDKCKDHDEYNTNLPPKDSVSNVDFTQQSVDRNPMMTPVADPPLRKRLRCSPTQLNNDVTIDISNAEDDATISDKYESGLSRVSQSSRLDSIKGKCIVNPQLKTKAKPTAFLASNYCRTLPTKIYVPIKEEGDHWYLMVISLLDGKLYQFDSNLNDDQVEPRQEIMKSLALKLSDMVTSGHYLKGDIPERKDFMNFDVKEGRGRDSGLWVLQWLSMREKFNPTVSGILNEQYIRTSVVVDLLLGMFNDHKYEFQKKSNEFWAAL
ncbi:hypothetical protein Ahy_A07g032345 [Arachis hypogaea]|uniref:Ubiquitin-like protease family profile domain-containing protein n=1 Tax=Arachis hypogaea TaxID=3818 RepID=A0A445C6Q1_ARAHY|nr:hypothetical protein Ahy_A07g032345 [Arachis hypogaea]